MEERGSTVKTGNEPYRKRAPKSKYTRFILDPFQIFCIEKRGDYMKAHPEMKNSEVTYHLGVIWRGMSPEEKIIYKNLAMQLQNNTCQVQRGKQKAHSDSSKTDSNSPQNSSASGEGSEPDLENDGATLKVPQIYVVPRGNLGADISDVSLSLLNEFQKGKAHPHKPN